MKRSFSFFKGTASILTVAVTLNFIWEMVQMPFLKGMEFSDAESWKTCFYAGIGDAFIVLVVYLWAFCSSATWIGRVT